MFTSHPLESDGVNPNFFYSLAKEDKKALRSCRVNIPPTVLFEQGFAKAVFATATSKQHEGESGEVKRKAGRDVDSQDIWDMFARGVQEGDICAVLMYATNRSSDLSSVRFLDKAGLKTFLYDEIEKPKSLLQKFVKPKGNNNTLIHAIWSPLMVLTEGRRNTHSLTDRHLSVAVRGSTFEDSGSRTVEVVVARAVVQQIAATCQAVAEHLERAERIQVNRIACYFKVDECNSLQLICSTSLRVQDIVTGHNNNCVSLSTALHAGGKKVNVQKTEADDQKALDAAAERTKTLKMSIPSMPDTATMLHFSIHHPFASSPHRSRSPGLNQTKRQTPPREKSPPLQSPVSSERSLPQAAARAASSMAGSSSRRRPSPLSTGGIMTPPLLSPLTSPTVHFDHKAGRKGAHSGAVSPTTQVSGGSLGSPLSKRGSGKEYELPGPAADPKLVFVAPGAPLPQSPQLMRYQHLLPNSQANLELARRQRELHTTEAEVRHEWETFLLNENRSLQQLTQKSKEVQAVQVAEEQSASIAAALQKREAVVAPSTAHRTTFDLVTQQKTDDDSASPMARKEKEEAEMRKQRELATLLAKDDKQRFMEEVKQIMGKKALLLEAKHKKDHDVQADEEEDAKRFEAVLKEIDRRQVEQSRRVAPNKMPKSVLLPPTFSPGGTASPSLKGAHRSSLQSSHAKRTVEHDSAVQQQHLPPKKKTRGGRPEPLNPSDLDASPSGKRASPAVTTTGGAKARTPTTTGEAGKLPGIAPGGTQQTVVSSPAGAVSKGGGTGAGSTRRLIRRSTSGIPDTAASLLNRRSKLSTAEDEYSSLAADEAKYLEKKVEEECSAFRLYIHELFYAVYCFFLENSRGVPAYVEIPERFEKFIGAKDLLLICHKLHGQVEKRKKYLRNTKPPWAVSLTHYRETMLQKLHVGALAQFLPSNETSDIDEEPLPENTTSAHASTQHRKSLLNVSGGHLTSPLSPGGHKTFSLFASQDNYSLHLDDDDPDVEPKYCVIFTPFERSFEILKNEYAEGIAEVEPYLEGPGGIFYHGAKRALYFDMLSLTEQEKLLATKTQPTTPEAVVVQPPSTTSTSETPTPLDIGQDDTTEWKTASRQPTPRQSAESSPLTSSPAQSIRRHADEDMYCNRCRTCRTCCVCSLVFGKRTQY